MIFLYIKKIQSVAKHVGDICNLRNKEPETSLGYQQNCVSKAK